MSHSTSIPPKGVVRQSYPGLSVLNSGRPARPPPQRSNPTARNPMNYRDARRSAPPNLGQPQNVPSVLKPRNNHANDKFRISKKADKSPLPKHSALPSTKKTNLTDMTREYSEYQEETKEVEEVLRQTRDLRTENPKLNELSTRQIAVLEKLVESHKSRDSKLRQELIDLGGSHLDHVARFYADLAAEVTREEVVEASKGNDGVSSSDVTPSAGGRDDPIVIYEDDDMEARQGVAGADEEGEDVGGLRGGRRPLNLLLGSPYDKEPTPPSPTYTPAAPRSQGPTPTSPLYYAPDSPLFQGPDSPRFQGPDSPVFRGPDSPVFQGADSPVFQGADSPVFQGADFPLHWEPASPQYAPQLPPYAEPAAPRYAPAAPRFQGPENPYFQGPDYAHHQIPYVIPLNEQTSPRHEAPTPPHHHHAPSPVPSSGPSNPSAHSEPWSLLDGFDLDWEEL